MSAEDVAAYERARQKWPNQPLIIFECGGQLEILPIGARLTTFTTHRIVGIINADESAMVVEPAIEVRQ